MTDVPADSGAPGQEPAAPSDPPVVRRSNYSPPSPEAELLSFDDDALADAMAAEVRSYTQPITLPKPLAAEQPVAQAAAPPSGSTSWDGHPVEAEVPVADHDDDLLRSLGSASTLEAIERLEKQLKLLSSGEIPIVNPAPVQQAPPVVEAPDPPVAAAVDPPVVGTTQDDGAPEPALDHPAPGHFFPAAFEPIAPQAAPPESAAPLSPAPVLPDVDESLIDPAAAAEVNAAVFAPDLAPDLATEPADDASENSWLSAVEPVDGAWDLAADVAEPPVAEPAAAEPLVVEPSVAWPTVIDSPTTLEPDAGVIAVPISTDPPVGPEAPDWLDAPPPSYQPPELIEPPAFLDTPVGAVPEVGSDVDAPQEPISANTMAQLPKPLPTEQPKLEDRAELPPPPGYDNIPIMWGDVAAAPPPVAPTMFLPSTPVETATTSATVTPEATETSALDHDEDDVIDEVDRVSGTGAIPISRAGTIDPLSPPSEPIATLRLGEDQPALVDKKAQQPSAFEVESAGPEPTALDLRAGRAARLFWLWFAANSSVLSLGLGAVLLGTGMSLRQAIVATLAGVAISFLPLGLGTLAGKWSGQPTMIVSRATFGHVGNILPALLAIATRVLWGGVLLWLLATAVAQVVVGAGLDAGLGTTIWQLVGLVAGFVIATVIAVFGYGFVAKLQLVLSILSALLIVGAAVLTYQHLDFAKALTVPDGSWILVISGAALVFSVVGLAWVHSSSDLARYQRPASYGGSSMLWATFGATLPPFALIAWGAMLAASDPALAKGLTTNPLAAIATLLPAWYPAPLLAAAAIGLLSGAVLTMYSGGFALQALGVRARRSFATFVSAILVLATGAALIFVVTDFSSLLRDLVITVAVPVAAWAGIFAAEMMIRTRRFHAASLLAPGGLYPQVRWLNLLALIVVSGAGLGLVTSKVPWLQWEGFLYGLLGIGPHDLLAGSDAGVFVALLLGILVPLIGGVPAIRRQERSPVPR
jgi:purine-cytosine permease-like protein